jgi:hypothetical protein
MKTLSILILAGVIAFVTSCGSNSENDSLSNPRQTDDVNARNQEADRIHDSVQNTNSTSMNDTTHNTSSSSATISSPGNNVSGDSSRNK